MLLLETFWIMPTSNSRFPLIRLHTALVRRGVFALFLALSVVGIGLAVRPSLARQNPQELVRQGDKNWNEQSYELALEAYQKALAADPKLPNRAEIDYRIMVALGRAKKWDRAIKAAEGYIVTYRDTVWEARGQVWRGRLYRTVDHNGYKVGKKIMRGSDVPKSEGGEAPEQVGLEAEDYQKAEAAMTRAQELFERFRTSHFGAAEREALTTAEIDLDFDLAETSAREDDIDRFNIAQTDWTIDTHLPYDRHWPAARRVMYLYEKIMQLDADRPTTDHHATVLATLGKAAYILQLRQRNSGSQRLQGYRRIGRQRIPIYIHHALPYEMIEPIDLLLDVLQRYPNDPEADRLAYTVALWTEQKGDFLKAADRYIAFLHTYPKSRWSSDAKRQLANLTTPALSLSVPNVARPGQKAVVQVNTRNVSQVHLTAYRVHLETLFGHTESREKDGILRRPSFDDLERHFHPGDANPAYRAAKMAEWTITTSNDGKYNAAYDNVATPLDTPGAYIVEARAGASNQLRATTLVIVSDIALVQKVDKDSVLAYVVDSETGKPVPGVKLTVWEPVRLYSSEPEQDASYVNGTTDSEGQFRTLLPLPVDDEGRNQEEVRKRAQVFAFAGGNRYAVSGITGFESRDLPQGERAFRAFVYTDRPLYRPSQAVNLRVVMTEGKPGAYHLAIGKEALLKVIGPHGELLHKNIKMGEQGSFNDSFTLPAGADLGDWNIRVEALPERKLPMALIYGAATFRIEEYKKPEFAVTVAPDKDLVRVGEPMKMTIAGQYFFGGPVAHAKVHYKVMRSPLVHPLPFPPRLAWFDYEGANQSNSTRYLRRLEQERGIDYTYWGNPGTIYREGDLTTDAEGNAHLMFPTTPPKPPKGYRTNPGLLNDQSFTVTAEVVDDSRRQVTGQGTARAGVAQFHAALKVDRKFLLSGDTLQIEGRTQDSNEAPFATTGEINIYRLIPEIPEQKVIDPDTGKWKIVVKYEPPREELAATMWLTTDAKEGKGFAFWHPDTPADYRIEYVAKDDHKHEVTAGAAVLVYGPNFDTRLKKDDGRFEVTPEFAEYRAGDTARVLIVAPVPDSYVLFTEAAAGGIVRSRSLFVPGRSTLVDVPIAQMHVPNARFTATLVQGGTVREQQADVVVPAENRIMALTLTPDKAEYKPGEHATFTLHAVGADGRPVQGEISLGVVDAALFAMQADLTPDIRSYFYGYRIPFDLPQSDSTQFSVTMHVVAPATPPYEEHELRFPEGMGWLSEHENNGNLPSLPGYVAYTPPRTYEEQWENARHLVDAYDINGDAAALGATVREAAVSAPGGAPQRPESANAPLLTNGNGAPGHSLSYYADGTLAKAPPAEGARKKSYFGADRMPGSGGFPGAPLVEATVRSKFADTAFWIPAVVTDAQGNATVSFDFPDNLTKWTAVARGVSGDVQVGFVEAQTVTKKNLLVRMQAPRFFVDRDQVTLSANIHNYLSAAKSARVELVTDGGVFTLASGTPAVRTVQVEKDGEIRVDWTVDVKKAGQTKIKVVAQTDQESDAAVLTFPVLVHGVEKFVVQSGVLHDGGEATLTYDLPEMRRQGASLLDVQLNPSLAATLLDALPYLEDYPYGCTEQTLSRFVPTVLVAKSLRDNGIDLATLGKRAQELERQRAAIPPQQVYADSGYTYPKGAPGVLDAKELASRLFLNGRSHAPIFNDATLKAMTDAGLQRLASTQRDDGSWGWWPGSTVGDPYLTAYALEGLIHARQSDVVVKPEMITKAYDHLASHLNATEDLHLLAYFAYVLSLEGRNNTGPVRALAHDTLYPKRDRMNAYGQALLALALHQVKEEKMAQVVVRNLFTLAKRDADRGTTHWEGDADRYYWHWYNDKQETTAMVLRALVAVTPDAQNPADITTLAAGTVRWLVDNRRGGHWTSTRQTANVVEALLEYAKAQKEFAPDYTVTVDLDGKVQKTYTITAENALLFDNRFLVGDELLSSGAQHLHITMKGRGSLYYNGYLKFFDQSEPIKGVANAIAVERSYFKIVPHSRRNKAGEMEDTSERILLADGATLASGDIIEVELHLKSDNDYDYLVFEDMKPAGCEAVETRSGTAYGDGLCSNFELRDEKVAFFVDTLPQGERRITYKLRAEIPGKFHALPTNAYAMYTPDIRALSDEFRITVTDAPAVTAVPKAGKTRHK
ncbi:MAG: hypothetical protein JWL77_5043 [Chthonomonadaceae bacterium]|nr:hypothetical protein [Chthonomonadaceae bacterium]